MPVSRVAARHPSRSGSGPPARAGQGSWLGWPIPVGFLFLYLAAITVCGKGPTYLFHPPFIWGEMTLALLLAWMYLRSLARMTGHRFAHSRILGVLILSYLAQGAVGIAGGLRYGQNAIRDGELVYFSLFYFIGVYIGTHPMWADLLWRRLQVVWMVALGWTAFNLVTGHALIQLSPVIPWRGERLLTNSGSELVEHSFLAVVLLLLAPEFIQGLRMRIWWLMGGTASGLSVLLFTRGRGVKVAAMCSFLVGLVASVGRKPAIWPLSRVFAVGILGAQALLILAIGIGPSGLGALTKFDRFQKGVKVQGTAQWRAVWWMALNEEVLSKNPLMGIGFGQSLSRWSPYLQARKSTFPVRSPHNFNITVYARMGLLGLGTWLAILAVGLGGLARQVRRGGNRLGRYTLERRKELTFWLIMLVTTWVNASFGVLMEGPVLGIWFWFALGFAGGRSVAPDGVQPKTPEAHAVVA